MENYFTAQKIEELINKHNWELVRSENGKYKLRQKDKHYMETIAFHVTDEIINKFFITKAKHGVD